MMNEAKIREAARAEAAAIVAKVRGDYHGASPEQLRVRAVAMASRGDSRWSAHLALSPSKGEDAVVLSGLGDAEAAALSEAADAYRAEVLAEVDRLFALPLAGATS